MIKFKQKKLMVCLSTLILTACANHSQSDHDYCVYSDPSSPYFNPEKLSNGQLEECKLRLATLLEIQAIQTDINKQRFSESSSLEKKNALLTIQPQKEATLKQPSLDVVSDKQVSQSSAEMKTQSLPKKPISKPIKIPQELVADKRKPLYHRDAGQAVDFNYEVIITPAGENFVARQLEELKSTEPVAINTNENEMSQGGKKTSLADQDPIAAILARQQQAPKALTLPDEQTQPLNQQSVKNANPELSKTSSTELKNTEQSDAQNKEPDNSVAKIVKPPIESPKEAKEANSLLLLQQLKDNTSQESSDPQGSVSSLFEDIIPVNDKEKEQKKENLEEMVTPKKPEAPDNSQILPVPSI